MGVALSEDEVWALLEESLTGILTTVSPDGFAVPLPVWFVALDRKIYLRTARTSAKCRRILRDNRVGFLVESGERWAELRAVSMRALATIVADDLLAARVMAARAVKYRGRGLGDDAPPATMRHYSRTSAVICLTPVVSPISWDNSRIRR
ncbi:pyridoxamine 5'-phosphate oxidase family protein [Mycobacterium sp. 236(2023)]|uniref:pyridoxamine 5'-phosphate oxidase family protein n=1 Tax=Mycobacterium sp. 236(2023) TaxID=3038163 RepID=UPI00241544AB|nr:pyridoxamine 5'-phosphate oxidase family protein [Mycobacterium sp. 236(2023)]MDG4668081.1 pyridoxamine 5'-phosphate oxidase family protein [Mycobacterium sp. 236(2023)]